MKDAAILSELQRIAEAHGGMLRPADVVAAAEPDDSPLHDHFEWDDSKAGAAYRLWQARTLIRVSVTYTPVSPGKQVAHRVFVSLTPDRDIDGGGYRVVTDVLSDADLRAQMLADAKREMLAWRRKYQTLHELAEVFAAIDRAEVPQDLLAAASA